LHSEFQEFNLFVYHSLRGVFYDCVIWCLGPLADESRRYGLMRCCLALVTRRACRIWIQ
jgi:hypothetical protein